MPFSVALTRACALISVVVFSTIACAQGVREQFRFGGTQAQATTGVGPTTVDQQRVQSQIADFIANHGPLSTATLVGPQYLVHPAAGTLGRDVFTTNYVDLQRGTGLQDFLCGSWTYEGHDAEDVVIRTFEAMDVGVPVFAPLPGVVIAQHDGEPDRNVVIAGQAANFVVIDHGGGRLGYYWHLKSGSVIVSVGQQVSAGEQIGMIGSSGASNYPHLHFATYDSGVPVEAYSGSCNPGSSAFAVQPDVLFDFRILDQATTWQGPDVNGGPPQVMPRGGHVGLSDSFVYFWIIAANLPAQASWEVRIRRPDGSSAYESPITPFGNPSSFRWSWWWWGYDVPDMHRIPGRWSIDLLVDGDFRERMHVDVVPQRTAGFRRSPRLQHVELDPLPDASGPARCVVENGCGAEDPDYDIVRYHYRWFVNGSLARDVTSAATSDLLPVGSFALGDTVQCTVTAGDGVMQSVERFTALRVGSAASLAFPSPGEAGAVNTFQFRDFTPANFIAFYWSLQPGTLPLSFGPCSTQLNLTSPGIVDFVPTNFSGDAAWSTWVPPQAAGVRVLMQAVDFGRCEPSNLIRFRIR